MIISLFLSAAAATHQPVTSAPKIVTVSTVTTSEIAGICAADHGTDEADFCTGYILATYDELSLDGQICPSRGATTRQASAIGRKFVADHPEQWDRHPAFVLRSAFQAAFPCKEIRP